MVNTPSSSAQDQEPKSGKTPEKNVFEILLDEKKVGDSGESEETVEQTLGQEAKTHQQLRQKIESIDLTDALKQQASAQANTINLLDEEEKMKALLQAAKDKGVVYAVSMAKKMNDPYLLDKLHDTLAREGHYKEFLK